MKYLILIFINLFSAALMAQSGSGNITGKVIDARSKQPIPFANVVIMGTNYGAASGVNGEFVIENVPFNTYQVRASVIGYNSVTKTDVVVQPGRPARVEFELLEGSVELENVTVTTDYFERSPLEVNSIKSFSYEEIRRSPGGFEDVVRALSVLPGVAQADAGRNDLIVRGGAPSENLYLIDGIEVSNINHFGGQGVSGGPLSYINLDFVRETSFSTGGFSALYGDKLSSVLSIRLRDGRNDRIGGKGTISASQFGLNVEGPIGDKSNFIFSARRSYLDFIFKAAGFAFVPEYYDGMLKVDFNPSIENSFSFLLISAFDNVRFFNETEEQRFDNSRILGSDQIQYVTGLSYRRLIKNGFINLSLSRNFIDYNTIQSDLQLNPIFLNKSLEKENTFRGEVTWKMSENSEISAGGSAKLIEANYNVLFPSFVTSFGDILPVSNFQSENTYSKFSLFFNYNRMLFGRLSMNAGVRGDLFTALNNPVSYSPRLSFMYRINPLTNISFSSGIYHQTPSYIWLEAFESNRDLKMIKVYQYVAGIERRLSADALLKVEGFYKDYSNYPTSVVRPYLVLSNTGAGFEGSESNFSSFGLEPLVSEGYGRARGIELSLQKKLSEIPFYGLFSLTYSNSDYVGLDGIERAGSYDQNWLVNLSGGYKLNEYWEVSTKFRFASGAPFTPYDAVGGQRVADYNTKRLKSAHSFDVRVDRRWFFNGWTLITYLDVQNVYNRKNATAVRWDPKEMKVDESSSIGILPTIGISAEF
jgi:hypothetical protein